jgi:hypothetical protein
MLSLRHEILVELFRQRPALALELLQARTRVELHGVTAEQGSIDLAQVTPTEYRSDAMTIARNARGVAIAAVITEIQLRIDTEKRRTWPLYVAAARASLGCPVTLLVFAPRPAVARWARQPIELGHPDFCLRPIVFGCDQIPRIPDAATARAAPELAVLSALAHRDLQAAKLARAGLDTVSDDNKKLYWDVVIAALPALARRTLEARMIKGYEYQSDFARKYYSQGRDQGREEGLRSAIVEMVCGHSPELRDELSSRLRDRPEAVLVRIVAALSKANKRERKATLDRLLEAPAKPRPRAGSAPARRAVRAR